MVNAWRGKEQGGKRKGGRSTRESGHPPKSSVGWAKAHQDRSLDDERVSPGITAMVGQGPPYIFPRRRALREKDRAFPHPKAPRLRGGESNLSVISVLSAHGSPPSRGKRAGFDVLYGVLETVTGGARDAGEAHRRPPGQSRRATRKPVRFHQISRGIFPPMKNRPA